jgi:hypothetical protein
MLGMTRKIERALAFHVTCTSPKPFLAPTLRLRPPPSNRRSTPTPSLAIFLFHVRHPVIYVIAPFIMQLLLLLLYNNNNNSNTL